MPRPSTTSPPTVPASLPSSSAARITAVGKALYGPTWQKSLAEAIGVARSTLIRWFKPTSRVPDDLNERLRAAVVARRREIKEHGTELGRLATMLEKRK